MNGATNVEATTPTRSLMGALRDSKTAHVMVAAGALWGSAAPCVNPLLEAHARAALRIAPDPKATVNYVTVMAEQILRNKFMRGSGPVVADDALSLLRSAHDSGLSHRQLLALAHEVGSARGFTPEALHQLTGALDEVVNHAKLPAALDTHASELVKVAVRGPLMAADSARFDDVRQGADADCYFAAAAAAVVLRDPGFPRRIMEEVTSLDGSKRAYTVKLSANFLNLPLQQHTLTVPDRVWAPATAQTTSSYAHNPDDRAHWFQILESAAAQMAGDYGALEQGVGFAALARITGLTTHYTYTGMLTNRDALFASLLQHDNAGDAMTTGSHAFADPAFAARVGAAFATLHEYAIIDVSGNNAADGKITLYNPLGRMLEITVDEFARNFLGFSWVDLNSTPPAMQPLDVLIAVRPRRQSSVLDDGDDEACG